MPYLVPDIHCLTLDHHTWLFMQVIHPLGELSSNNSYHVQPTIENLMESNSEGMCLLSIFMLHRCIIILYIKYCCLFDLTSIASRLLYIDPRIIPIIYCSSLGLIWHSYLIIFSHFQFIDILIGCSSMWENVYSSLILLAYFWSIGSHLEDFVALSFSY